MPKKKILKDSKPKTIIFTEALDIKIKNEATNRSISESSLIRMIVTEYFKNKV